MVLVVLGENPARKAELDDLTVKKPCIASGNDSNAKKNILMVADFVPSKICEATKQLSDYGAIKWPSLGICKSS
jgi:hypothetical protein